MKKLIAILIVWAQNGPAQDVASEYTRMLIQQQQHDYTIRETVVITNPDNRQERPRTYQIEHYYDRQPTALELILESE